MSMNYGIPAQQRHHEHTPEQAPARYLVLIDSGEGRLARLYLEDRREVAEFDAGAEEVSSMIRSVQPTGNAEGEEWNRALSAHSAVERREAQVYTLAV